MGKVLDLQHDTFFVCIDFREHVIHRTADHHRDQLFRCNIFYGSFSNIRAVTENSYGISHFKDFFQSVGNVNDGTPFLFQPSDNGKELLLFALCQRGRRFIHNDQLGIVGNCLRNFNHLHLSNRQVDHQCFGIHIQIDLFQNLFTVLIHLLMIDKPKLVDRFTTQPDIFHDRAIFNRRQFLMDHRNSHVQRIGSIIFGDGFAVKDDLSGCYRLDPDQAFHQRGFTRAVLTAKRMYLTALHIQINTF